MFFEAIVLGIVFSKLTGGKLGKIVDVEINKIWIIVLGIGLETLGMIYFYRYGIVNYSIIKFINILSYLIFIIGLSYNNELKGFKVLILGSILNLLPVIFNGGKMPVSMKALETLGDYNKIDLLFADEVFTHSLADMDTRLKILIDFIPLSKPYPLIKVISLGDIFLFIGIIIFIYGTSKIEKEV